MIVFGKISGQNSEVIRRLNKLNQDTVTLTSLLLGSERIVDHEYLDKLDFKLEHAEVFTLSQRTSHRLQKSWAELFKKTTRRDLFFALIKTKVAGAVATMSYVFSDVPLPLAVFTGALFGGVQAGLYQALVDRWTDFIERNPYTKFLKMYGSEVLYLSAPTAFLYAHGIVPDATTIEMTLNTLFTAGTSFVLFGPWMALISQMKADQLKKSPEDAVMISRNTSIKYLVATLFSISATVLMHFGNHMGIEQMATVGEVTMGSLGVLGGISYVTYNAKKVKGCFKNFFILP